MITSKAIESLKEALRALPGVGPKNAQRMAFHLLERNREGAQAIAQALQHALDTVITCKRCNTFSESEICDICASPKRDTELLCIVETPTDLDAIEQMGVFNGLYFVLMGRLSPLENQGPETLALPLLQEVVRQYPPTEIVIATNITAEGETTAEYVHQLLQSTGARITRLARGVPVGGELEYMDQRTLAAAFKDRR